MPFVSQNPATDEIIEKYPDWNDEQLEEALVQVAIATPGWAATPVSERCEHVRRLGQEVLRQRDRLAETISREMGKLTTEARAEVEKCALVCDYYADNGPAFLADEVIETDAGKSLVAHLPIGTVLAVMPWNFPLWQVFRFLAPALVAGNTGVLKHASNVPQCALAIEELVRTAGLPEGVFRTLMIASRQVAGVIEDARIRAVTLTGSEPAGRQVAATAGTNLKKTVLELGGSDPFIVLEDADLDWAAAQGVASRFLNAGQSCIAAKRFIVVESVADQFLARFKQGVEALKPGDPMDEATTLGPMARQDLRDELHQQVQDSLVKGAVAVTGCTPVDGPGAFYQASILDNVKPGMPAWDQEFFGPVAIVIRARDEQEAVKIANGSDFGLGGSVWTQDAERGEAVARKVQSGAVFVNGLVKSDPRLPFGGIKNSGYGRELCHHGMMEFVNQKTIWIK
jgi:succinate-semialdehyde dehydrogenase/glutarate-semialdehyde dehydrogenase